MLNIGEAASASGVSAKMIPHYEASVLLPPVRRTESGYRQNRRRPSRQVKALAQQHIAALDRKAQELLAMKSSREQLVQGCNADDRPECRPGSLARPSPAPCGPAATREITLEAL